VSAAAVIAALPGAPAVDEQAERHGAQVLPSEAHRETFRGRVLLGGDRRIDARRERLP
jgi:hypothetical protein